MFASRRVCPPSRYMHGKNMVKVYNCEQVDMLLDGLRDEVSENGKKATPFTYDSKWAEMRAVLVQRDLAAQLKLIAKIDHPTLTLPGYTRPLYRFLDEMDFENRGGWYVFDESNALPREEPVTVAAKLEEVKDLATAYGWKLEMM